MWLRLFRDPIRLGSQWLFSNLVAKFADFFGTHATFSVFSWKKNSAVGFSCIYLFIAPYAFSFIQVVIDTFCRDIRKWLHLEYVPFFCLFLSLDAENPFFIIHWK